MQSPLFPFRKKVLGALFSAGVLKSVWKAKARFGMRKHHLVDPIDNLDFHQNIGHEVDALEKILTSGSYAPLPPKRILVEKSRGLCRQIVIPQIRDALILQCLSDALYNDIKGQAPTNKAFFEPDDHSFNKSENVFFAPGYGSYKAWLNFQQELFRFSREYKFVVITDIANYYDTISYSHLRNIISDLNIGVREPVLDMLVYILNGLLWRPDYMPNVEMGLPQVNSDAPRILAHCFLYELDRFLDAKGAGDFARYMDDLDIGTDSIPEAKQLLREIDLALHTRQIRLNSGKTLILTQADAAKFYRTKDNRFLGYAQKHIDRKIKKGLSLNPERLFLRSQISTAYGLNRFDGGNGEKILKRVVKIANKIGAEIDDTLLYEIALKRPALREPILRLVAQLPATTGRIYAVHQLLISGHLVDDSSFVAIATSLCEVVVHPDIKIILAMRALVTDFPEETDCQLYGKIMLASKYWSEVEILALLKKHRSRWCDDYWLGRLVGCLYPRFLPSKKAGEFRALVKSGACEPAAQTYDFHEAIASDNTAFLKSFDYINAGNPSKRSSTSHSKFLMAVSALANSKADKVKRDKIVASLSRAWGDSFYRNIVSLAAGAPPPPPPIVPFPYP